MADLLANQSFENLADGAAVTTANTPALSNVPNGTPTASTLYAATGTKGIRFDAAAGLETISSIWAARNMASLRFYLWAASMPAAATYIWVPLSTGTTRAQIGIDAAAAGKSTLRIRNGTALVATTTAQMDPSTGYRVEWRGDSTAGVAAQQLRLYLGHSTSPLDEITGTFNTGTFDRLLGGIAVAGTWDYVQDDIRITDQYEWIGPSQTGFTAPTGLTATAVSPTQVNLSWNPVSGATGYDIERDGTVIATDYADVTYSDTGRSPATTYTYRVRAVQ